MELSIRSMPRVAPDIAPGSAKSLQSAHPLPSLKTMMAGLIRRIATRVDRMTRIKAKET
jgi:hypothetical protein